MKKKAAAKKATTKKKVATTAKAPVDRKKLVGKTMKYKKLNKNVKVIDIQKNSPDGKGVVIELPDGKKKNVSVNSLS